MRDVGCLEPILNCLFHSRGHRYRPNVPCFAYQIDYGPMVLRTIAWNYAIFPTLLL
jgi:hypothetical protein